MTHYENGNGSINQLDNIVNAINNRQKIYQAAYTIVIEKPGRETIRPLGAPCLNYIAVQLTPGNPRTISLLCIYRNHDFLERAYGNYWGLCNLIKFLSEETQSTPGALTCVSSHAYVNSNKTQILELLRGIR
jgi:thymidylate synthase